MLPEASNIVQHTSPAQRTAMSEEAQKLIKLQGLTHL